MCGGLEKINRGQSLDVQRFGQKNGVRALSTENELDEYTYLVAGCVGEFWTGPVLSTPAEICRPVDRGDAGLWCAYGKGLQLINILRDAGSDFRNGRCYFPKGELRRNQRRA